MTLHLDLPPDVEARLVNAAQSRDQTVEQLASRLLAHMPDDPVLLALLLAEEDDEPVTEEDLADIDAARARMDAGGGIPHAEVLRLRKERRDDTAH